MDVLVESRGRPRLRCVRRGVGLSVLGVCWEMGEVGVDGASSLMGCGEKQGDVGVVIVDMGAVVVVVVVVVVGWFCETAGAKSPQRDGVRDVLYVSGEKVAGSIVSRHAWSRTNGA